MKYKQGFEDTKTHFHLPLDMINLVHARKAQSLVSEQEYRQLLHQYTSLTDDLRLQCAKNAYKLQSEVIAKYPSSISQLGVIEDNSFPNCSS